MGQGVAGGSGGEGMEIVEKGKISALVVDDVKVIKKEVRVEVPKYVDKEQIKYVNKEEKQVKYNTMEETTTKFNVEEKSTVKYVPKEEDTVRYIPKDVEVEKAIIKEKVLTITTFKDVDAIKAMAALVPGLVKAVDELTEKLKTVKDYKLVEQIVKADKIQFVPTEVERIVWKDVSRERCSKCSKEVG